jgi:hypothetical protein
MNTQTLVNTLQSLGQPTLSQAAESIIVERDAALQDAWTVRHQNEQLRERLHQVVAERNELMSK